jgi:hypothetical protein
VRVKEVQVRKKAVTVQSLVLASILASVGIATTTAPAAAQLVRGAPETFVAEAQAKGAAGALSATITIHVQRYTPDFDRKSVETALKSGGYPAFLTALRKAPEVGYVAAGTEKFAIRWARERPSDKGREITIVTDRPVFFIGGGAAKPKPRAGYEVAVIQLQVDDAGAGTGTMAAAARVKPGDPAGVQIDDYAEQPIALAGVKRMGA